MKAIVQSKYGLPDVLEHKEVEKPAPKDNEVLVKVFAASMNAAEMHTVSGKPFIMRLAGFGLITAIFKEIGPLKSSHSDGNKLLHPLE